MADSMTITPGTPLPWKRRDGHYITIEGAPREGQRYGDPVTTLTGSIACQRGYGRQNADYWIHASNNHAPLLAALEEVTALAAGSALPNTVFSQAIARARQAIQNAKASHD